MHKNKLLIVFGLFVLIFTLSSFNTTTEPEPAASIYKNLKVLPQDISKDQMKDIMDAWCSSLNVSCSFCHVKGNMAADDKDEKVIARKMLTMTNEINEKYFGKDSGTVSCMTCHNGKANPSEAK